MAGLDWQPNDNNALFPDTSKAFDLRTSLDLEQHLTGIPSKGPQGMPGLPDLSHLNLDGQDVEAIYEGFLAQDESLPFQSKVNDLISQPAFDGAVRKGQQLFQSGSNLYGELTKSGSAFAGDLGASIRSVIGERLSAALESWNDPGNRVHNSLDHQIGIEVENLKATLQDINRSNWFAKVKDKFNLASQKGESLASWVSKKAGWFSGDSSGLTAEEFNSLNQAEERIKQDLVDLSESPDFLKTFQTAFGADVELNEAQRIVDEVVSGDGGPEIEVIDAEKLQGAAAYGGDRIFVSEELLTRSMDDPDFLDQVLLEEMGHHFDQVLNAVDSPGDEGDIFARLVKGNTVSSRELLRLQNENDFSTLALEDATISIENSAIPVDPSDRRLYIQAAQRGNPEALERFDTALATQAPTPQPKTVEVGLSTQRSGYDEEVKQWQQTLKDLGYDIDVDGYFGAQTEAITREFQADNRLSIDGIVGTNTQHSADSLLSAQQNTDVDNAIPVDPSDRKLYIQAAQDGNPEALEKFDAALDAQSETANVELSINQSGYDEGVKQWQQTLKDLGYEIDVDGYFGSQTDAITKQFQQDNDLTVDGIVGTETYTTSESILDSGQEAYDLSKKEEELVKEIESIDEQLDNLGTTSDSVTKALYDRRSSLQEDLDIVELEAKIESLSQQIENLGTTSDSVTQALIEEKTVLELQLRKIELEDMPATGSHTVDEAHRKELDDVNRRLAEFENPAPNHQETLVQTDSEMLDVESIGRGGRSEEIITRSFSYLDDELIAQVKDQLTPENLILIAISNNPVGKFYSVVTSLRDYYDIGKQLWEVIKAIDNGKTENDLDIAAQSLASAIVMGGIELIGGSKRDKNESDQQVEVTDTSTARIDGESTSSTTSDVSSVHNSVYGGPLLIKAGDTDLSSFAQDRRAEIFGTSSRGNIVVVRLDNGEIKYYPNDPPLHSEDIMLSDLAERLPEITEIYSERQFCSKQCAQNIQSLIGIPGQLREDIELTYAYPTGVNPD